MGQSRRYGSQDRGAGLLPQTLVVAEEEEFVLLDRATDCPTELIMDKRWYRTGSQLGKGVPRLLRVGAAKFEGRSMEVIAARFGLRCDQPRNGGSELSVVVLRGDLHLGNGIKVGIDDRYTLDRILIVGAIELITGGEGELSVHLDLLALLRIGGLADAPPDIGGTG